MRSRFRSLVFSGWRLLATSHSPGLSFYHHA
jgi:hypothetical protein